MFNLHRVYGWRRLVLLTGKPSLHMVSPCQQFAVYPSGCISAAKTTRHVCMLWAGVDHVNNEFLRILASVQLCCGLVSIDRVNELLCITAHWEPVDSFGFLASDLNAVQANQPVFVLRAPSTSTSGIDVGHRVHASVFTSCFSMMETQRSTVIMGAGSLAGSSHRRFFLEVWIYICVFAKAYRQTHVLTLTVTVSALPQYKCVPGWGLLLYRCAGLLGLYPRWPRKFRYRLA